MNRSNMLLLFAAHYIIVILSLLMQAALLTIILADGIAPQYYHYLTTISISTGIVTLVSAAAIHLAL